MKILIAEDDVISRTMLRTALGKWGYEVLETSGGEEAWSAFQKTDAPQLAVLDWMMPGIDGPTLSETSWTGAERPLVPDPAHFQRREWRYCLRT